MVTGFASLPGKLKKTALRKAPGKIVHAKGGLAGTYELVIDGEIVHVEVVGEPSSAVGKVVVDLSGRDTVVIGDSLERIYSATPSEMVEIERQGVSGAFIFDMAERLGLPTSRVFNIIGVPKATAARKQEPGAVVAGRAGLAAIGMAKLLGIAKEIVQDSAAQEAKVFDTAKWLGQWIERPQPALGGKKPSEFLDTPTGTSIVARLLGSLHSGAYQ